MLIPETPDPSPPKTSQKQITNVWYTPRRCRGTRPISLPALGQDGEECFHLERVATSASPFQDLSHGDDISANLLALEELQREFHTDLLVINKTDPAPAVGADLNVMARDAQRMRGVGPFLFAQVRNGVGVPEIIEHILHAWQHSRGIAHSH